MDINDKLGPKWVLIVGGLITSCYGGSFILIPLVATMLLKVMDITSAFKALGTVMMVIVASSFLIKKAPVISQTSTQTNIHRSECTYKEMLMKPYFYIMLFVLMCGAFLGMLIISQTSSIVQRMMSIRFTTAAAIVSLIAFANTSGRIVSVMI